MFCRLAKSHRSNDETAKEGEFRSNLHRGGKAKLVKLTPEERSIANRAAKVMGLNVAVSILFDQSTDHLFLR